ncbi:MAG: carboxymuconolactone decarboxylase family protein, partial [Betaproteobacteria bacterium]
ALALILGTLVARSTESFEPDVRAFDQLVTLREIALGQGRELGPRADERIGTHTTEVISDLGHAQARSAMLTSRLSLYIRGGAMSSQANSSDPADARRFKLIPVENLSPEQRKLYDAIRSGPRAKIADSGASTPGPLGGPFNVWLRSPAIGDCVQRLGEEIRFRSSLPAKLNELAIIITARFWTSQYEWHAHRKLALDAGLDPAIAQAIAEGRRPANLDAAEAVIYDFSRELHESHEVSDATYQRALERFGERGVFDLIAVNGFYSLVSMCLNVDRTPLPKGVPTPLK